MLRPKAVEPGTVDTLSTSGPLCILIIPCAPLSDFSIVPRRLCRMPIVQYSQSSQIVPCWTLPTPPFVNAECHHRARQGRGIQDQPSRTSPWQRIMRHLHNYCEALYPLLQSATIPPCRMTRYARCIHGPTDRVQL